MTMVLDDSAWDSYQRDGFLRLGPLLGEAEIASLCQLADDLLAGRAVEPAVELRLSASPTEREIGALHDTRFAAFLRQPLVAELAARQCGRHAPVTVLGPRLGWQPAAAGTWWQDAGGDAQLDREPLLAVWVPLTPLHGLELHRGSHRHGLLQAADEALDPALVAREYPLAPTSIELAPGEGLAMHALTLRRWRQDSPLRGCRLLGASLLDARTLDTVTGQRLPPLFGRRPPAEEELPFLRRLHAELRQLRDRALPDQVLEARSNALAAAERHAEDLQDRARRLHEMFLEAERYALSLREANQRLEQQYGEAERYARDLERHLRELTPPPASE